MLMSTWEWKEKWKKMKWNRNRIVEAHGISHEWIGSLLMHFCSHRISGSKLWKHFNEKKNGIFWISCRAQKGKNAYWNCQIPTTINQSRTGGRSPTFSHISLQNWARCSCHSVKNLTFYSNRENSQTSIKFEKKKWRWRLSVLGRFHAPFVLIVVKWDGVEKNIYTTRLTVLKRH